MVGRSISFWDDLFSEAMLVLRSVSSSSSFVIHHYHHQPAPTTNHHCQQHTEAWQDLHVPQELLAWLCRERPESVTLRNELFRHQNKPLYIKLTLVVVSVAGWGLDPSGFLHIVSFLKPKD